MSAMPVKPKPTMCNCRTCFGLRSGQINWMKKATK